MLVDFATPASQNGASHYITEHMAKLMPPFAFKPVLRARSLLLAWLAECNWFVIMKRRSK